VIVVQYRNLSKGGDRFTPSGINTMDVTANANPVYNGSCTYGIVTSNNIECQPEKGNIDSEYGVRMQGAIWTNAYYSIRMQRVL
jgi:hypothetical protein